MAALTARRCAASSVRRGTARAMATAIVARRTIGAYGWAAVPDVDGGHRYAPRVLAAVLSVVAAALYTFGLAMQQLGGRAGDDEPTGRLRTAVRIATRPMWMAGFALTIVGFVLHGAALSFGSLTLVQLLQTTQILFVVPIGATDQPHDHRPARLVRRRAGGDRDHRPAAGLPPERGRRRRDAGRLGADDARRRAGGRHHVRRRPRPPDAAGAAARPGRRLRVRHRRGDPQDRVRRPRRGAHARPAVRRTGVGDAGAGADRRGHPEHGAARRPAVGGPVDDDDRHAR